MSDADARAFGEIARTLDASGASLTLVPPGLPPAKLGVEPGRAEVRFGSERSLRALLRRDHLALAEAFMAGEITFDGDGKEAIRVIDALDMGGDWLHRGAQALRLLLRNRLRYDRESIAVQYDLPPEFYLAWLDPLRAYSHGFYAREDEPLAEAQLRKLGYALEALGVRPGDRVLDMGCGWGCFIEYAGARGIRVHGITISERQYAFVSDLIERKQLPCSVEKINLLEFRPEAPFDGAVFLGTLEHVPETRRVMRFLSEHLVPGARFYADFCASRDGRTIGRFMKRYLWPGPIRYIDLGDLVKNVVAGGFNVLSLEDDTLDYAFTVRDWGDALEREQERLTPIVGEATFRAYQLFLRGSYHYLRTHRMQAHHLVAGPPHT